MYIECNLGNLTEATTACHVLFTKFYLQPANDFDNIYVKTQ